MKYCRRHDLGFCSQHLHLCFEDCAMVESANLDFCSVCAGIYKPPTASKLGKVLVESLAPPSLVDEAYAGHFDDFRSASATPIMDLVQTLRAHGYDALAKRAINGDWDGTIEESTAWFEREGRQLLSKE